MLVSVILESVPQRTPGSGGTVLPPLRHCSGAGARFAPLRLLRPPENPGSPCVSVCYCSHCTHRLLHLHVAHGRVWSSFRPVRQLLVAAGLRVQQVGQRAQLEVVSIYHPREKKKIKNRARISTRLWNQERGNRCQRVITCDDLALPLKGDSSTGAGLRARNSFLAYLLSAPLFSVGTMSWRMKRARSRMS